jgi:hypothetical protein
MEFSKNRWYTTNHPVSWVVLYLIQGHVAIATAFFLSHLFSSKKSAVVVGYVALIALGLCGFLLVENLLGDYGNLDYG